MKTTFEQRAAKSLTPEQKSDLKALINMADVLNDELPIMKYYLTGKNIGMSVAQPVDEYLTMMKDYLKIARQLI